MARIRTIKPELARHEALYEAEKRTGFPLRFAWAMFSTICDREGRFKWRPRSLKPDILPYDELSFEDVLESFRALGLVVKYEHDGEWFGWVPTFAKHQLVNRREAASGLPVPPERRANTRTEPCREQRGREGKGKEQEGNTDSPEARASAQTTTRPFLEFPTIGPDGSVWALSEAQVAEWVQLFPNVNIRQESRAALAWVLANPGRRKTVRGMPKFLVGWFSRTANRGGSRQLETPQQQESSTDYLERIGWCSHTPKCLDSDVCRSLRAAAKRKVAV